MAALGGLQLLTSLALCGFQEVGLARAAIYMRLPFHATRIGSPAVTDLMLSNTGTILFAGGVPMAAAASQPLASASHSTSASPSARILYIKLLDTKPRWLGRRSRPSEQDMGALCEGLGFRV